MSKERSTDVSKCDENLGVPVSGGIIQPLTEADKKKTTEMNDRWLQPKSKTGLGAEIPPDLIE